MKNLVRDTATVECVNGPPAPRRQYGGTPADIQEDLNAYVDAGVGHIILSFLNYARGDTPRLFKDAVAPAFQ